jgi:hypothetical protein
LLKTGLRLNIFWEIDRKPLGENFTPGGKLHPWGKTSPLGENFTPGDKLFKTGLRFHNFWEIHRKAVDRNLSFRQFSLSKKVKPRRKFPPPFDDLLKRKKIGSQKVTVVIMFQYFIRLVSQ